MCCASPFTFSDAYSRETRICMLYGGISFARTIQSASFALLEAQVRLKPPARWVGECE
jgi:hypothetical protein